METGKQTAHSEAVLARHGITTRQLAESADFGIEVLGADLSEIGAARNSEVTAALRDLLANYLVLLFRQQHLPPEDLERATQIFGTIAVRDSWSVAQQRYKYPYPDQPHLRVMTETTPSSTAVRWHVDAPFLPTTIDFLILHAVEAAPTVATTDFLDMRAVFAEFPNEYQDRLRAMTVQFTSEPSNDVDVQDYDARPASAETAFMRPLVFRHPVTGHESLMVSSGRRHRILDLPEVDSDELISEIYDRATLVRHFLSHAWATGDVLLWDNYSTNHRQGPAGYGARRIHKFHGAWAPA